MCVYNYEAHRIDLSVSCFFFSLSFFFFLVLEFSHVFYCIFKFRQDQN